MWGISQASQQRPVGRCAPPEAAFSGPLDGVAKALWCPTPRRLPLLARGPEKAVRWVFNIETWYQIFVRERGGPVPFVDEERVVRAIELTRFPIPDDSDHQETKTEAGLLRAADLIGQLADPRYLQKLSNLYHEFVETGTAEKLGLTSAADLADRYPGFYWNAVQPYIANAIEYLRLTQEGKQWIANLHSHVFAIEHGQFRFGPFPGIE